MTAQSTATPLPASRPRNRRILVGYLLAATGAAMFASKGVIIKLSYAEGIGTGALLALRMGLALPIYAVAGASAVAERRRAGLPLPSAGIVAKTCLIGLVGYWFASYTDFLGLIYISAQFERLILFTYPGFVVLFGVLFFGQHVRPTAVLAFAVSYLGLAVVFAGDAGAGGSHALLGVVLVLSSAIAFAVYQLFAKELIAGMGPQLFTSIAMSSACVALLGQFAVTEPMSDLLVGRKLFGYGVLLALGATVIPSFLMSAAMQRISAQANAVISTLSPIVTIALAVSILGEPFGMAELLGTALVIGGVGWFTLVERKG